MFRNNPSKVRWIEGWDHTCQKQYVDSLNHNCQSIVNSIIMDCTRVPGTYLQNNVKHSTLIPDPELKTVQVSHKPLHHHNNARLEVPYNNNRYNINETLCTINNKYKSRIVLKTWSNRFPIWYCWHFQRLWLILLLL